MLLEPDVCYRALTSRDARFDGRLYVGVTSTGIYCRPVCPARTPKRANVRFFPCAAAAAEAGFRPCLRCRPETSPGTPAWLGSSATVSRALRLIADGMLDDSDVPALAERLGVGERHLRRLFAQHLGASPLAVRDTRRVHFAKSLLDQTELPITRIALASGFGSIRRFNSSMQRAYGMAPRALRRGRRAAGAEELCLRLAYRRPFDFCGLLAFLRPRAIPGVERVEAARYARSVCLDGAQGSIAVEDDPSAAQLRLRVTPSLCPVLPRVVQRVRRLFDLGADPEAIAGPLARDPLLAPVLAQHPGLRVPGAFDGFELVVRAILGQQVSVAGATTLAGRLAARFGEPLPGGEGWLLFPTPERLVRAQVGRIGLPDARAQAIRTVAREVAKGRLELDAPAGLDDALSRLTALPGIGPWTAAYVAMRALGEPDAFPAGDLGLRKAAGGGTPVSERALAERAESWRPWRAYAAMALWRSLSID